MRMLEGKMAPECAVKVWAKQISVPAIEAMWPWPTGCVQGWWRSGGRMERASPPWSVRVKRQPCGYWLNKALFHKRSTDRGTVEEKLSKIYAYPWKREGFGQAAQPTCDAESLRNAARRVFWIRLLWIQAKYLKFWSANALHTQKTYKQMPLRQKELQQLGLWAVALRQNQTRLKDAMMVRSK